MEAILSEAMEELANAKGFELEQRIITRYPDDTETDEFGITQSLLQKWLREEHRLHITIYSKSQESWMFRITRPGQTLEEGMYNEDFDNYEEALDYALEACLNMI